MKAPLTGPGSDPRVVGLLLANAVAAALFLLLPIGGWIESDFRMVFGDTLGTVICGLLTWAHPLILFLAGLGNFGLLGLVNLSRTEQGAEPQRRAAWLIATGWAIVLALRGWLYVMRGW